MLPATFIQKEVVAPRVKGSVHGHTVSDLHHGHGTVKSTIAHCPHQKQR